VSSGIRRRDILLNGTHDILLKPSGDMMSIMLINKYEYCVSVVKLFEMFTCVTRK
jgi:hypothetical protein